MKLLQVTRRYVPEVIGGYERNCQVFAEEWVRRGHDVAVLTRASGNGQRSFTADGVTVFPGLPDVPVHRSRGFLQGRLYQLRVAAANRRARAHTRHLLRTWKPDAVVFWGMNSWLVSPILACHDLAVPCLADLGDYWLVEALEMYLPLSQRRAWYRQSVMLGGRLQPSMLREAWVHSRYMRERYIAAGLPATTVRVIPRGLDRAYTEAEPPRRQVDGTVRILCVGRLVPDKGARVLAQAFVSLRRRLDNVELHFYGDAWDWYRQDLERDCRDAGLLDAGIFIHERVDPNEMRRVYGQHDILAFPVLWNEPSSNVLLEAMAMRLPIVATDTGSNAEFVGAGETGFLVPAGDAGTLADRLHALCVDAGLRQRMGDAARRRVITDNRQQDVFDATEARLRAHTS